MNTDKIRRRQNLKVIISEAIMVLAVIATVAVLALVVSGYWLNSDFEVERQGMLQISSVPTGANLIIDGEDPSWFQRTNTSKILASGEHEIRLEKDGYDSWSRTINITEGLLYRIHYPRLFLLDRTSEPVLDTAKYTFATVSPDAKIMLMLGDTTEWALVNLDSDQPKLEPLDVSALFAENNTLLSSEPAASSESATPSVFDGEILDASWDTNSEHILFKIRSHDQIIWALLDIMNVKNSLNLTKEFGASFDHMEIYDHSASTLLALESGNLRKIDTRNKTISATLVKDVIDFDYYDNEIVFSATKPVTAESGAATSSDADSSSTADAAEASDTPEASEPANPYYLGYFKLGSSDIKELATFPEPFSLAILQFYDDKFIATLSANNLVIYDKTDFTKSSTYELSFSPVGLEVGHQGEFITLMSGHNSLATLDMEDKSLREWAVDGSGFGWLTSDMIFSVKSGELFVYDFDGLNRRSLAANVSSHFPATITADKWLYYFSDGTLMREVIAK